MSGWTRGGVKGYVGVPRCGKTTKATADAREDAARTRFPIVTLDLGSALSFAALPHASCADEVLYDAYVRRVHPKVWTPASLAEREKFWAVVMEFGAVHVIADEIYHLTSKDRRQALDPTLSLAVTKWGHGKRGPASYYLTAQRPKFIHRDLWHAFDVLYVFRLMKGVDADRIEHEFGLPPEVTTNLERGEYEPVQLGFTDAPPQAEAGGGASDRSLRDPDAPSAGGGRDAEGGAA